MLMTMLALQAVTQTLTGEYVIRDAQLVEANLSLPVVQTAQEVHQWAAFTSGNWYVLENDCLRLADNGLVCKDPQREKDEK
ncbi:TPA: hypothetical protein RUZ22_001923 [Vibrio cholerae]|nr:hypothetical protein [Vibrio cholerae]